MSDRGKEIWGMLWRFALVMVVCWLAAGIVISLVRAAGGNEYIQMAGCVSVWLVPMFLAYRARQENQPD